MLKAFFQQPLESGHPFRLLASELLEPLHDHAGTGGNVAEATEPSILRNGVPIGGSRISTTRYAAGLTLRFIVALQFLLCHAWTRRFE